MPTRAKEGESRVGGTMGNKSKYKRSISSRWYWADPSFIGYMCFRSFQILCSGTEQTIGDERYYLFGDVCCFRLHIGWNGMGGGRSHTQLFITKPLNGLFNQNYFSIHQHSLRWLWLALLDLWQSSVILLRICYGQKQESSPVVLWLYCCKFSLFHLLHCFFL